LRRGEGGNLFRRRLGVDSRCLLARLLAYGKSERAASLALRVAESEWKPSKTHIDSTTSRRRYSLLDQMRGGEVRSGLVIV
jgi:hypothetical protein